MTFFWFFRFETADASDDIIEVVVRLQGALQLSIARPATMRRDNATNAAAER